MHICVNKYQKWNAVLVCEKVLLFRVFGRLVHSNYLAGEVVWEAEGAEEVQVLQAIVENRYLLYFNIGYLNHLNNQVSQP